MEKHHIALAVLGLTLSVLAIWAFITWRRGYKVAIESLRSGSNMPGSRTPTARLTNTTFYAGNSRKSTASTPVEAESIPAENKRGKLSWFSKFFKDGTSEADKAARKVEDEESKTVRNFILVVMGIALTSFYFLGCTRWELLVIVSPLAGVVIPGSFGYNLMITGLFGAAAKLIELLSIAVFERSFQQYGLWYYVPWGVALFTMIKWSGISPGSAGCVVFFGNALWFRLDSGPYFEAPVAKIIELPSAEQLLRIYNKDDPQDFGLNIQTKAGKRGQDQGEEKVAEGTTLAFVRISVRWEIFDIVRAVRFINLKGDEAVDWEKKHRLVFENQLVSVVKSFVRPLLNGTHYDDLLNDETKEKVNSDRNLKPLNNSLHATMGIRITSILLEKATPEPKLAELLAGTLYEGLELAKESKDADALAFLFNKVITKVLGFTPETTWKDLTEEERKTVESLVLQGQGKVNSNDAAIANAIRSIFGKHTPDSSENQRKGPRSQGRKSGTGNSDKSQAKKTEKVDEDKEQNKK
ncbi:MAG TPA: hypothetical protein VGE62_00240 [Candidatus Paceibacterota bacterium]